MSTIAVLALSTLLFGCAHTGHSLRNAGAGGTAPSADAPARAEPHEEDARFREPVRPGTGRVSVR